MFFVAWNGTWSLLLKKLFKKTSIKLLFGLLKIYFNIVWYTVLGKHYWIKQVKNSLIWNNLKNPWIKAIELKITIGRICDRLEDQRTKVFKYFHKFAHTINLKTKPLYSGSNKNYYWMARRIWVVKQFAVMWMTCSKMSPRFFWQYPVIGGLGTWANAFCYTTILLVYKGTTEQEYLSNLLIELM